ncbi:coiled-coil domain-containing protein 69 isoform X2 [Phyllopteryx taeniolatus]|uniref:coiled-coil domain-containing protein 69 isoform X2 n=1 Tax=Phyllopteryx taeniolatus TaxID=161469 RepID=UPI002AD4BE15|nr:coiled-coil domain-containing protein 69 isoform X2 [Phyllopteryx taeniolatus]
MRRQSLATGPPEGPRASPPGPHTRADAMDRRQVVGLAAVTVAAVLQQAYFSLQVISARRKFGVPPPCTSGPPHFERVFRAQVNCSEYFPLFIAILWTSGVFFSQGVSCVCGVAYLYARARYFRGYAMSPQQRKFPMLKVNEPRESRSSLPVASVNASACKSGRAVRCGAFRNFEKFPAITRRRRRKREPAEKDAAERRGRHGLRPQQDVERVHEEVKVQLTEKFQISENLLKGELSELKAELEPYNELKRRVQEATFKKDLLRNIQAHGSPGAFWESEQESLLFVIEMKSERLREQNKKLQRLEQLTRVPRARRRARGVGASAFVQPGVDARERGAPLQTPTRRRVPRPRRGRHHAVLIGPRGRRLYIGHASNRKSI